MVNQKAVLMIKGLSESLSAVHSCIKPKMSNLNKFKKWTALDLDPLYTVLALIVRVSSQYKQVVMYHMLFFLYDMFAFQYHGHIYSEVSLTFTARGNRML